VVAARIRPWGGVGVRLIPANSPFGVLDTRFAGRVGDNRWNRAGDPTFYVASDESVALAEFARHFREQEDAALSPLAIERALYRLDVQVQALLDLRQPVVRAALGLHGGARRFLDIEVARATASFIRRTTSAEALLVPSIAFLDDPARWNLVLFLEKLPPDLTQFISVTPAGTFPHRTVEPAAPWRDRELRGAEQITPVVARQSSQAAPIPVPIAPPDRAS
jgi:RES domain-containing protein